MLNSVAYLRPQIGKLPQVAPLTGQSPRTEGIGPWHALWGDTSALFIFYCLLACLICLPALITTACDRTVDRPVPSFIYINSPWVRGRRGGHHPAPHRMPFNKKSFLLATTVIELS